MAEPRVFIFWDNSNIYISGQQVGDRKEGLFAHKTFRIDFDHLFHLAHADRPVDSAIAVGSIPPELRQLWGEFEKATGVRAVLHERGAQSGREQAEDAVLQVHMLRALCDERDPQIAVLMTGDGKGYEDGVGFHADLERMADRGWAIEVLAWEHSCRKRLRKWAERVGVFIPLDRYYESVTFLESHRFVQPLNLTHRPCAKPKAPRPVFIIPSAKPASAPIQPIALTPEQQREMKWQQRRERGKRKQEKRLKAMQKRGKRKGK